MGYRNGVTESLLDCDSLGGAPQPIDRAIAQRTAGCAVDASAVLPRGSGCGPGNICKYGYTGGYEKNNFKKKKSVSFHKQGRKEERKKERKKGRTPPIPIAARGAADWLSGRLVSPSCGFLPGSARFFSGRCHVLSCCPSLSVLVVSLYFVPSYLQVRKKERTNEQRITST